MNVEPSKPRTLQKQSNRLNLPTENVSQHFERNITLPLLDHLINQIDTRFSGRNIAVLNGFYAFPSKVVSLGDWRQKFAIFFNDCMEDLPKPRYIKTELNMWEAHWRRVKGVPPSTLSDLLPFIDKISFPNIYIITDPCHIASDNMYL